MAIEQVLVPWLVWAVPMAGAVFTPIFAAFNYKLRDYAAVFLSLLSAILAALMLPTALAGGSIHHQVDWIPSVNNIRAGILADPLSIIMANIVAWISFLIMAYSLGYMKGEAGLTRYWFFMLFFIGNMQLIVLSDNFLQLFFGWEGVGLSSYALIGFWHTDEKKYWVGIPGQEALKVPLAYSPSHAGMKALITTKVGDISFLIGLLILYYFSNTFEFLKLAEDTGWAKEMASAGLFVPVALLIFGGAIGKSAQFPLHEWLPDAMAGPTSVSALIHAATMVKAGVFLVARVGPIFYLAATSAQLVAPLFEAIAWIGAFTGLLAATQAMVSREVKKVLAYSTVSQIGLMMLALGAAGLMANFTAGFTAGLFHLMNHAIFKAALFMGAGALIHACKSKYMDEMGGIRGEMKITFATMMVAAASLSGIPPFGGFWSKDAIISATLEAGAIALFLLAVMTSLITAFYSFRLIGMVFFGGKSHQLEGQRVREAPPVMWAPYALLAGATLVVGLLGPSLEDGLHKVLGGYLEGSFGIGEPEAVAEGLSPPALLSSLSAVIAGSALGLYFYTVGRPYRERILERSPLVRWAHNFFENRWYINSIYYIVFVHTFIGLGRRAFRGLEVGVMDRFNLASADASVALSSLSDKFDIYVVDGLMNAIAKLGVLLSGVAKRVQTGVTEQYAFAFVLGAVAVALFMLMGGVV